MIAITSYDAGQSESVKKQRVIYRSFIIATLGGHKDELENMQFTLEHKFDVMAITETKIKKCIEPAFIPSLKGYKFNHTPAESEYGGTILYFADHITSKNKKCYFTNQKNLNHHS